MKPSTSIRILRIFIYANGFIIGYQLISYIKGSPNFSPWLMGIAVIAVLTCLFVLDSLKARTQED